MLIILLEVVEVLILVLLVLVGRAAAVYLDSSALLGREEGESLAIRVRRLLFASRDLS